MLHNRVLSAGFATVLAIGLPILELRCQPQVFASEVNSTEVNGIDLNGIQLNGIMLNGIQLNGIMLNGIMLNGIMLNGTHSTSTVLTNPAAQLRVEGGQLILQAEVS